MSVSIRKPAKDAHVAAGLDHRSGVLGALLVAADRSPAQSLEIFP
ncbi:hypothetical protein [Brevundimonas sp. LM2]|nr:hypothetical protein [Brevundimonas sp. LM2]